MTSQSANLSEPVMDCPFTGKPLTALEIQRLKQAQQQREQVRQRLVAAHSSAPLYQARAAKDPEYWNTFYLGQIS